MEVQNEEGQACLWNKEKDLSMVLSPLGRQCKKAHTVRRGCYTLLGGGFLWQEKVFFYSFIKAIKLNKLLLLACFEVDFGHYL
jgi:hypothetical protein